MPWTSASLTWHFQLQQMCVLGLGEQSPGYKTCSPCCYHSVALEKLVPFCFSSISYKGKITVNNSGTREGTQSIIWLLILRGIRVEQEFKGRGLHGRVLIATFLCWVILASKHKGSFPTSGTAHWWGIPSLLSRGCGRGKNNKLLLLFLQACWQPLPYNSESSLVNLGPETHSA